MSYMRYMGNQEGRADGRFHGDFGCVRKDITKPSKSRFGRLQPLKKVTLLSVVGEAVMGTHG